MTVTMRTKIGLFAHTTGAIILMDMRTRFGRSHASYIAAILWPLTHMFIIFAANVFLNRLMPVGDDPGVFISTGLIPYVMCLYPARFTAMAVVHNRALLAFPAIMTIHIVAARVILEMISASVVLIIFATVLYAMDLAILPTDVYVASTATLLAVCLGISLGTFGMILCSNSPTIGNLTVIGLMLLMYFTSGIFFASQNLPASVKSLMYFNPLYHVVGLLRSAYYSSYSFEDLSYAYVIGISALLLGSGLASERFIRGKM